MAVLEYNEIKPRKYIVYENEPFEVLTSHVFRKQMRKPVNATKLKNMITGKVMEVSFHQSEKVAEADLEKREVRYLYTNKGESWFCEKNDPGRRFKLSAEIIGRALDYVKANDLVVLLAFAEKPLGLSVPIKVDLKVAEAAPAVKGNTVQGGLKQIKLETGKILNVPMFINEGDIIRLNTDTGEYVERVNSSA